MRKSKQRYHVGDIVETRYHDGSGSVYYSLILDYDKKWDQYKIWDIVNGEMVYANPDIDMDICTNEVIYDSKKGSNG